MLALVLAIIISAIENFFQLSKIRNLWKYITCAIGGASIGGAISAIVYFILGIFLHPAHVDARIVTTHPISGMIATINSVSPHAHPVSDTTTKDLSASETKDDDPFSLIPRDAELEKVELIERDSSEFRWIKTHDDTTFSLSIYAFSGCVTDSELNNALSDKAIYVRENIRNLRFLGDGDMQEILIDGQQSDFVILNKKKSISFTLKEGTTDSSLYISQFLADANLQAKTSGDLSIKLTRWLLERDEEKSHFIQRNISLFIDGEQKQISFAPLASNSDDEDLDCNILHNERSALNNLQFDTDPVAGLFIRIQRTNEPDGYVNDYDGQYELDNMSGWVRTPAVKMRYLSHSGKINKIYLDDSISEIKVEGKPQELSQGHWFDGLGSLTASYIDEGRLYVNGEYCTAWIDGKRINPTRWETFPIAFKIALGTLLLTVLAWITRLFAKLWRNDQRWSWAK